MTTTGAGRPNIFTWATRELSQDAFLAWLISWADTNCEGIDPALHETGVEFVTALCRCASASTPARPLSVKIRKQFKSLDLLALVNETHAILIEDKIGTKEHSEQLPRYADAILDEYPEREQVKIFLKTEEQSDTHRIAQAGFSVFSRKKLLQVLQRGVADGVANAIFVDFVDHLQRIDDSVEAYATEPPSRWRELWYPWQGFFARLQEAIPDGRWDYVPNASGGFMGFWWHGRRECYLTIAETVLCFKINVEDRESRARERQSWHDRVMRAAESLDFAARKPKRFGTGKDMTVAELDGDYLKLDSTGRLDFQATLQVLRSAEQVVDRAAREG